MTYQEKVDNFLKKGARVAFHNKTPFEELPIEFSWCSSSHPPDMEVGVETSDFVLWVKFLDHWFKPYGGFQSAQIEEMINICKNDLQIESLMNLLSATDK